MLRNVDDNKILFFVMCNINAISVVYIVILKKGFRVLFPT
jgi:hypothetical protein